MDISAISETFKSQVGSLSVSSPLIKAGVIVALIFILLLVMAKITRRYMSWYTNGWWIWVILGFLLAVILDGFFVIGGSTLFTSVLGWKNAPKPIQTVLDGSRQSLSNVLGANKEAPSASSVIGDFELLNSDSASQVRGRICTPEELIP